MTEVAIVAGPADGDFAAAIRDRLRSESIQAKIFGSLPADTAVRVVLLWSAAFDALRTVDAQALVGLWSEGRLQVVRRDATPLPLGMRDLPFLPPESGAQQVVESLTGQSKTAGSPGAWISKAATFAALMGAIMFISGGAYYYLTAEQRSKQAALTARLEEAGKASEELNKAKQAEVEAQKALADARQAELEAIKRGDTAKLKELEKARMNAEAGAEKQVELVAQREAAREKAIDNARKSQDAAKSAKAEMKDVEKSAVAAPAPKADAPRMEAPKAEAPKAVAAAPTIASTNTVVASAAPPDPATEASPPNSDALYRQAQELEAGGKANEAVRIYRRLARAGHGQSAKRLGDIYDRGVPGVSRDYAESLQWYGTARELGVQVEVAGKRAEAPKVAAAAAAPKVEVPTPASGPADGTVPGWLLFAVAFVVLFALAAIWRQRSRSGRAPASERPLSAAATPAMLFVSYSHKDKRLIDPIVSLMESMGRQVWMDRTAITGQAGWAGQIVRAIRDCRAVVLMASPNSYSSDQVVRELYLAMNHKKTIVPIEIEPAELPDELQYILAPFQHHRLSGGETKAILGRALAAV